MNTIGVLLLAAATATGGIGKPHVGKVFLRNHAVRYGAPPAEGMMDPSMFGGAGGPGGAGGGFGAQRQFASTISQVYFVEPSNMKIGWQSGGAGAAPVYMPGVLSVPARYNFRQGYIYRLKLTDIPGRPSMALYPTLEVAPSTPATDAYLTHNPIPVQFTEEDFDQVGAGNFVTKVIYLPDPKYQELAVAGVETLVSTRLEPGIDPVREADKRGTILMIVRLGAIDLEVPPSGVSNVPTAINAAPAPNIMAPPLNPVPTTIPAPVGEVAPAPPEPEAPAAPAPAEPEAPAPAEPGAPAEPAPASGPLSLPEIPTP